MATKKVNLTPIPKPVTRRRSKKLTVTVCFDEQPELYKDLLKTAKKNFRTPEEQILYCVWKQTNPEQENDY